MTSTLRRFGVVLGVSVLSFAVVVGAALAQAWQPTRPIDVIVPSAPGGGLDLAARTLQEVIEQEKLSPASVTVVNRPGGGGTVSIAFINTHAGDGHYVTVQALPLITNHITGLSTMDVSDITPLAELLTEQVVFSVAGDSPIKNAKDLLAQLRKDEPSVSIAVSSSPGGQSHDAAALVVKAAGLDPKKMKVVFFDSGGEAVTALMGGHVTVAVTPVGPILGPTQAGKVRPIAIAGSKREAGDLANVPTWKEAGVRAEFTTWRVLVGPRNMTPAQIAWWDAVLSKATSSPAWLAAARRNQWTPEYKNSARTRAFLGAEKVRLTPLLADLGLTK